MTLDQFNKLDDKTPLFCGFDTYFKSGDTIVDIDGYLDRKSPPIEMLALAPERDIFVCNQKHLTQLMYYGDVYVKAYGKRMLVMSCFQYKAWLKDPVLKKIESVPYPIISRPKYIAKNSHTIRTPFTEGLEIKDFWIKLCNEQ